MKNNLVSLEWEGDPVDLFCPACGTPIYVKDSSHQICPHVIFTYLDIIGNFDHIKKGWEKTASEVTEKAEEMDLDPYEVFRETISSPGFFLLQIVTHGIGHGLTGSTISIGVDFLAE